jgi:hypothetical protein
MSSVVTAIPSGPVHDWCIKGPWWGDYKATRSECANATLGTFPSDYETICCNGDIVDTTKKLRFGDAIDLADLVCCQLHGPQQGGIGPIISGPPTQCTSGSPVPLASLAATNTLNVQNYPVTYTSASVGSSTTGDFIPTEIPYCLWANTASGAVSLVNVTVPAAQITTLSSSSSAYSGVGMASMGTGISSTPTTSSKQSSTSTSDATSVSASRSVMKTMFILAAFYTGSVFCSAFC